MVRAVFWVLILGKTYKWIFGLTLRGSLDCVLKSVDSARSLAIVIPIITENCKDGTIFCSDGWKSYVDLPEHVNLQDTSIFAVNHTQNYVDPDTGHILKVLKDCGVIAKIFCLRMV